ncbi:MAG TPA: hypothetical protein VF601_14990 [Beijerinckiaceae bacterium]|jgi:hypothetical protein
MHDDTPASRDDPPSRALVPSVAPADPVRPAPRPLASFVTQLFACEAGLGPFRRRRRAGPDYGAASYEASDRAEDSVPARFERVL